MIPEFAYFLKVNIAFIFLYAFYRLLFYKDTYFKLRRTILLAFFVVSLLYPLMIIPGWVQGQKPIMDIMQMYSAILPEMTILDNVSETNWHNLPFSGIFYLYWGGVIALSLRFLVQMSCILRLARQSEVTSIRNVRIHLLDKPAGPFSFFRLIFLHPDSHSEKEIDEILAHECAHVNQWHSVDVIISELACIICWVNPFVWLLKREVRHNLEYLADDEVLESGYDSRNYQYHLLGLAHSQKPGASLSNNFNMLHLKNRIIMMNKKRSRSIGKIKYLIFVPVTCALLLLGNTVKHTRHQTFTIIEVMPKFPGGQASLLKYLATHIKYPAIAQKNGIQGRVSCSFVVDTDGSLKDIEVIRGIDPSLDNEAIRVIREMPKWNPGIQNGMAVAVKYTVPITFRLQ